MKKLDLSFPNPDDPMHRFSVLEFLPMEEIKELQPIQVKEYLQKISLRYKSLQSVWEDEGIDTRKEMEELASHLASVAHYFTTL